MHIAPMITIKMLLTGESCKPIRNGEQYHHNAYYFKPFCTNKHLRFFHITHGLEYTIRVKKTQQKKPGGGKTSQVYDICYYFILE